MDVKKADANQKSADSQSAAGATPSASPQTSPNLTSTRPRLSFSLTHANRRLSLDLTKISLNPAPTVANNVPEPFAPKPRSP